MNPRRHCLLACAVLAACFSPTGNTETSAATTTTSGASATSSDAATAPSSTTSGTGTSSAGTASATSATATTTVPDTSGTGSDTCGNGQLDDGEECDPNDQDSMDGCSGTCTKEFRRVFVTSTVFKGNLGGLAGADQKCQTAASSAGLPGSYRAWLSTPDASPADWLVHSSVPYRDMDGMEIAADWAGLIDGLEHGIFVSELGGEPGLGNHTCLQGSYPVWTNTRTDGTIYLQDMHCNDWEISEGHGFAGWAGSQNSQWTVNCMAGCEDEAALYCFEQ